MLKRADHQGLNPLCGKCLRDCRQPASVVLVECPRFFPLPFTIERPRFEQLELFTPTPPRKRG